NASHAFARDLHAVGIGIVSNQALHKRRRQSFHGFAMVERSKASCNELLLPIAIGLAEGWAGLRQYDGTGHTWMRYQPLLDNHATNRMPDKNGPVCVDLLQEILQRICQPRDTDICERSRTAIARHIPGDGAIASAEACDLAAPGPRRAADAMQEHQRRVIGIAGRFVAKAAVLGRHGRRHRMMLTGPPLSCKSFKYKI